jgi:hypothetical protein
LIVQECILKYCVINKIAVPRYMEHLSMSYVAPCRGRVLVSVSRIVKVIEQSTKPPDESTGSFRVIMKSASSKKPSKVLVEAVVIVY